MKNRWSHVDRVRFEGIAAALVAMTSCGCSGLINPFVDGTVPAEQITTPSECELEAVEVEPAIRHRTWPEIQMAAASGEVVHWPLWFEDPFEDKGSQDGKFAWRLEDFFALGYSPFRWFINGGGLPVSAIVTPPGTPMVSDGRLSRQALGFDHDAARVRDVGTRELNLPSGSPPRISRSE